MRITHQIHSTLTLTVDLPAAWTVVLDTQMLQAYLNAEVKREYSSVTVSGSASGAIFEASTLEVSPLIDPMERASAQMRRHVRQGEPDRFEATVNGKSAMGFEWTDGLDAIATWFVAVLPNLLLRFDVAAPFRTDGSSLESRRLGAELLATVVWH